MKPALMTSKKQTCPLTERQISGISIKLGRSPISEAPLDESLSVEMNQFSNLLKTEAITLLEIQQLTYV